MCLRRENGIGIQAILNIVMRFVSLKLKLSNICIDLHVESPLPGDEIGVGGQKLKMSNICIELHVESPLPPEWQQCLDLQVSFLLLFFFLITYCVFLLFMGFCCCCGCGEVEMAQISLHELSRELGKFNVRNKTNQPLQQCQ